jgi:hypothetical protein
MNDFVRKPYRFTEIYECLSKQLGVQYIYAEATPKIPTSVALTPKMFALVPRQLQQELCDVLGRLNEDRINVAIEQVATYDTNLSQALSQLAGDYNYPAMLDVLKETLAEPSP